MCKCNVLSTDCNISAYMTKSVSHKVFLIAIIIGLLDISDDLYDYIF